MEQRFSSAQVKVQFEEGEDQPSNILANFKDGHWNQDQIFRFVAFLVYNREGLKLKLQRRTSKVFKQMSEFVETRTSVQCRSQNQRLFRKFKTYRNIITAFKAEYGRDRFEEDYKMACRNPKIKFLTELESLLENKGKQTVECGTQTDCPLMPLAIRRQSTILEGPINWQAGGWPRTPGMMVFPYLS